MYNYKGTWMNGIIDKMNSEIAIREEQYRNRPFYFKIKWAITEEWVKILYKVKFRLDRYLLDVNKKYSITVKEKWY